MVVWSDVWGYLGYIKEPGALLGCLRGYLRGQIHRNGPGWSHHIISYNFCIALEVITFFPKCFQDNKISKCPYLYNNAWVMAFVRLFVSVREKL